MNQNFIFSVVMPIYNTAPYLEEAINSVVSQTIGFKDHIQLILVNDGSPDNAAEICDNFQKLYPDNIICLSQNNSGVSHARNRGLELATGKYINFFDSDDIWDAEAFQKALDFFEAHTDEIDVLFCIQEFFEARSGLHPLSKRLSVVDNIVDIHQDPKSLILSVTSSFIKTETAKHYRFDTEISIGEDSGYITRVIFEKEKYGILQDCKYHIRKRVSGDSLTQRPTKGKYTKTIDRYYYFLPKLSMEKYGLVIPYVQHAVLNGLKYRVLFDGELPLTQEEKEIYIEKVTALIRSLDNQVIIDAERMLPTTKLYLLALKHGDSLCKSLSINEYVLQFNNAPICKLGKHRLHLQRISIDHHHCRLNGIIQFPLLKDFLLRAHIDDTILEVPLENIPSLEKYSFRGDLVRNGQGFSIDLPLEKEVTKISFEILYHDHIIPQKPVFEADLDPLNSTSVSLQGRKIYTKRKQLYIEKSSL